jgi:CDP-diacylglycerol---glycerol-3-phosphate 3-phosphatidyltransferase
MRRHIPNQLTVLRLVLAGLFFLALNFYRFPGVNEWTLWVAGAVFILAAITDALDGYLARRWDVESAFGRIMDPFCDKVLIIGAFIYLAGPRFVDPAAVEQRAFFTMASGVYPWMVALMLARELLVTGIRDELEYSGIKFPAQFFGKLKMILQSVGVPVILGVTWLLPRCDHDAARAIAVGRDVLVYAIVLVTVLSGLPYVTSAARALKGSGFRVQGSGKDSGRQPEP